MQTNSESGSIFQEMSSSNTSAIHNRTRFFPTLMSLPMDTFLMKQTKLVHQMMLQINIAHKIHKPSAIITRPIGDDDENTHA